MGEEQETIGSGLKEIGELVKKTNEDVNAIIEKQNGEIKHLGEATEETKAQLEAASAKYNEVIDEFQTKVEATEARMSELEAKFDEPDVGGGSAAKSIGERFVESDNFKAMLDTPQSCKTDPVMIGSFASELQMLSTAREAKVLSSGAASAGDLVIPTQDTQIWRRPDRAATIRDLLLMGTTQSDSVEYWLRTGFFPLSTTCTAIEPIGETVIAVDSTDGFYVGQTVLIGTETRIIQAVTADTSITVTVAIGVATAVGTRVSSQFYAPQTELSPKPEGDITYDEQARAVRTIASWIRGSRQIFQDVPRLRSEVDNDLMYGLLLTEEREMLYGDNTGTHLDGITTQANIQTLNWSDGEAGDTRVDAIARGAGLCTVIDYPVTAVVVNPTDYVSMALEKAVDGHYLYLGGIEAHLGFPVIITNAITAGTALVGAFGFAAKLWDRQQASIRTTENYNDDFIRNAIVVLAEERLCLTVRLSSSRARGERRWKRK
jgi:HK97 family phage major capsid protein